MVILTIIGLVVLLAKPKPVPIEWAFVVPKIVINFDVLKSPKIQNLELLPEMDKQFDYQAKTAKGLDQKGRISAPSEEKAAEILTGLGLKLIILKEVGIGRDNPFLPYYEIKLPAPVKKK